MRKEDAVNCWEVLCGRPDAGGGWRRNLTGQEVGCGGRIMLVDAVGCRNAPL